MTGSGYALAGAAFFLAVAPGPTFAQDAPKPVAVYTAWSVYVWDNPKECALVSAPAESVNTRDGKPVAVRRGEIRLFVTYRPGAAQGEISFAGGYPFAPDSSPTLDIGGTVFNLFTDAATNPENAWSNSPEDDAKIIAAMKAGSSAILSARSQRGTQTKDTFSLNGASAALDEAAKRCAG
ncbi:MAG: invasion associated locus B family protein [Paracoccaceae bacterium]